MTDENTTLADEQEKYYTVEQVAQIFLVTERTVYRWIKLGIVHALQLMKSGKYRIPESEIARLRSERVS